ncbi:hypothetical protein VUR80DRAFT_163 [Thermomyces stellatus]
MWHHPDDMMRDLHFGLYPASAGTLADPTMTESHHNQDRPSHSAIGPRPDPTRKGTPARHRSLACCHPCTGQPRHSPSHPSRSPAPNRAPISGSINVMDCRAAFSSRPRGLRSLCHGLAGALAGGTKQVCRDGHGSPGPLSASAGPGKGNGVLLLSRLVRRRERFCSLLSPLATPPN